MVRIETISDELQDRIVHLYQQDGQSIREIVQTVGVSHPIIYRALRTHGVPLRKRLWTPEEDALLATDLTGAEIARLTLRTPDAVKQRRRYLNRRRQD